MAYKIVIDPGHGGQDPGAVWEGRREKDDNLDLGLAVGQLLEDRGIDVVYTRIDDVYNTPFEKATMGNNADADLFVSFHRNAAVNPGQGSGAEVLVYHDGGLPADVARSVLEGMEAAGFENRGVTERKDLVVLRRTGMPAVLLEVGFIDNPEDNAIFDDHFELLAQEIADGILNAIPADASAADSMSDWSEVNAGRTYGMEAEPGTGMSPDPGTADGTDMSLGQEKRATAGAEPGMTADMESDRDPDMESGMESGMTADPETDGLAGPGSRQDTARAAYPEDAALHGDGSDADRRRPPHPCAGCRPPYPGTGSRPPYPGAGSRPPYPGQTPPGSGQPERILYRVQTGAFRERRYADAMRNELLASGFPVFILYKDGLYKVQVGAFAVLDNAIRMERVLRNYGYNTYITT